MVHRLVETGDDAYGQDRGEILLVPVFLGGRFGLGNDLAGARAATQLNPSIQVLPRQLRQHLVGDTRCWWQRQRSMMG